MVDMGYYAEITETGDGDGLDAALKVGGGDFGGLSITCYRCGE